MRIDEKTWNALAGRLESTLAMLVAGLLVSLPLVLMGFALERELEQDLRNRQVDQIRHLEFRMAEVKNPEFDLRVFEEYFKGMLQHSCSQPNPSDQLVKEFKRARKAYPGVFEAVFFDADNQLIAHGSDLLEHHALLSEFGKNLGAWREGRPGSSNVDMPRYRKVLGPLCNGMGARAETLDRLLVAGFGRTRSLFYLSKKVRGMPWFIAWVSFLEDPRELAFRLGVEQRIHLKVPATIVDLSQPPDTWGQGLGPAQSLVLKGLGQLGDIEGQAIQAAGFFWSQIRVSARKRLLVAIPDEGLPPFLTARAHLRTGIAVTILVFVLGFALMRQTSIWPRSLRVRLLALFLYTTAIPLLLLTITARGLFLEQRQVMEKKVFQTQEEALTEFDRGFLDYCGWIEQVSAIKRKSPRNGRESEKKFALRTMEQIAALTKPGLWSLLDDTGKNLHQLTALQAKEYGEMSQLLGRLSFKLMAGINRTEATAEGSAKEQLLGATAESMGIDLESIWGDIWGSLDHMLWVDRFQGKYGFLTLLFPGGGKQAGYLASLLWSPIDATETYARERLESFQRKCPGMILGARVHRHMFPTRFPLPDQAMQMRERSDNQSTSNRGKVTSNGQTYLVSCLGGAETNLSLFASSTDEEIHRELRKTIIRLSFIGMLLLGFGSGLALLIGRTFLGPVRFLSEGLEAMKQRNFGKRIPIIGQDEFGQLSVAFNQMMENMADLEVARVVQETIFPQAPLADGKWEVHGVSHPATRVGGDYFDYFPLPDGRWLIVIGDVTGHGVPAALVVGMAKALVFHPANPPRPSEILDIMNRCLLHLLKTTRRMSCFLGIFDPRSGELVAANAGHCYPFIVGNGKSVEWMFNGSPLGSKSRRPFQESARQLPANEVFCLYTDGLIETLDTKGVAIGYERLGADLPGLIKAAAQETERAIMAWHDHLAAPGPRDDDITIVVLQRRK